VRIAVPGFGADGLSAGAWALEQLLRSVSVAGIAADCVVPWVGLTVAAVMLVVVASYRQNVRAYPSGGGDYEVATVNLGASAGLVVASALLVDYVLTVAVSISSAASNIGSALPFVATHKVAFAVVAITLLTAANLRGIRESGTAFAIPTYAFMIGINVMLGWGLIRVLLLGEHLRAESAGFGLRGEGNQLVGVALVFLVLRAFSSGCAALTGVEAISNGVPLFAKPKKVGYDGVELPLFAGDAAHYKRIRKELDNHGLGCNAVCCATPEAKPISPDPGLRQAGLDHLKWAIEMTATLGGENLCGPYHSPLGVFSGAGPTADEKKRAVEVLRKAAEEAKRAKVMLAIEYLNRFECYFLTTAADARALESSTVVTVPYGPLREALDRQPKALWSVVELLARRIRAVDEALAANPDVVLAMAFPNDFDIFCTPSRPSRIGVVSTTCDSCP